MRRHGKGLILPAALAAGLALAALAPTQGHAAKEIWKELLIKQLWDEKGCELNYLTNERWFELQGRASVKARAHCKDERQFDVEWQEDKQNFAIRLCQPTVC